MNISLTTGNGFTIHAFTQGKIVIEEQETRQKQEYTHSLILLPDQISLWPVGSYTDLTQENFKKLVAFDPEVILLGTGETLRFPENKLLIDIYATRIGFEVMSTDAACRTYNILMSDNRRVLAALII